MVYSYTQINQYLRCPRSYRYRYLGGWREKESRAVMAFGRSFEKALGAYFREEDCGAALFQEWEAYRDTTLEYEKGETWDRSPAESDIGSAQFYQNSLSETRFSECGGRRPELSLHLDVASATRRNRVPKWLLTAVLQQPDSTVLLLRCRISAKTAWFSHGMGPPHISQFTRTQV